MTAEISTATRRIRQTRQTPTTDDRGETREEVRMAGEAGTYDEGGILAGPPPF